MGMLNLWQVTITGLEDNVETLKNSVPQFSMKLAIWETTELYTKDQLLSQSIGSWTHVLNTHIIPTELYIKSVFSSFQTKNLMEIHERDELE